MCVCLAGTKPECVSFCICFKMVAYIHTPTDKVHPLMSSHTLIHVHHLYWPNTKMPGLI